jgi:uncharacterized membrane protein
MITYAEFIDWIHLIAMASYFGAQFAVIYMLMPAAQAAQDEAARRRVLITGFKFYNPYSIAMLGAVVISGAWRLTDLKATLKFEYFARMSGPLAIKLGLAFLLIFIQTYVTFGLAFRIGRQEEVAAHGDGEPFSVEQLDSMLARIRAMCWTTIVLAAAIVLVSITMVRRAVAEGTSASLTPLPAAEETSATGGMHSSAVYKARDRSEVTMYASVTTPKSSPGISLSVA